jgi:hypothetical protein
VCLYARPVLPDACGPAGVERECGRAKLLLECRPAPSLETGPANAEPGGRTGSADGLPAALDERAASANATWGSMLSDQFVRRPSPLVPPGATAIARKTRRRPPATPPRWRTPVLRPLHQGPQTGGPGPRTRQLTRRTRERCEDDPLGTRPLGFRCGVILCLPVQIGSGGMNTPRGRISIDTRRTTRRRKPIGRVPTRSSSHSRIRSHRTSRYVMYSSPGRWCAESADQEPI